MAENRQKLVHLHTPEVKKPTKDILELGEIAVQHNDAAAALYIKKNNGDIAKFIDETAVATKIEVEKNRAEGAEAALDTKIGTLSGSSHTHANKTVLDGITKEKVDAWDAAKADAISSAKTYTDSVASGKANTVHTHAIANVTGLQDALDGKAASAHTHEIADVTGLQTALDGKDSNGAAAKALEDAKKYADDLVKDEKGNVKFDAAGAAAQALEDAKSYADGLNTAMDARVDVLEASSHTHTNKTVLEGITAEKVAAWDAAKAGAISSAKTYTDNTIAALNLASTYEAKGTAQNLINGLKLAETYASKEVESKISTLIGDDTNKSVRSVASEEVAKIVNSADTRYDTLKEIADWIISDTTGAASMANDINALKAISADTRLGTLEAISAATRLGTLEAISADTRLGTLEAISADTRLVKLENASHTHKNKALLDTYTQTEVNLADAVAKKHAHDNKAVLDGITSAKVTAWNTAESKAKAYADGLAKNYDAAGAAATALETAKTYADDLNTAMNGRVVALEGDRHTHTNKTVLDKITDAKVSAWDAAEGNAKTYTDNQLKTLRIDCGEY